MILSLVGLNGIVCIIFGIPSRGINIRAAFTLFLNFFFLHICIIPKYESTRHSFPSHTYSTSSSLVNTKRFVVEDVFLQSNVSLISYE